MKTEEAAMNIFLLTILGHTVAVYRNAKDAKTDALAAAHEFGATENLNYTHGPLAYGIYGKPLVVVTLECLQETTTSND